MSLGEGQNKVQYVVTDARSSFPFAWKYWNSDDLVVVFLNSQSVETTLTIGDDYTVTPTNGDPENGATVDLVTAVENGTLTIFREVPFASDANFTTGDGIPPAELNALFDKAAAQSQQLEETIGRSLVFPQSDPAGINYTLAAVAVRAGKAILFDSLGNVTVGTIVNAGDFVIDPLAGLDDTANILSVKIDGAIFEFDVGGNITLLDGGISLSKLASISDGTFIGRSIGGGAGTPIAYPIIGDILETDLVTDPTNHGATSDAIKSYITAVRVIRQQRLSTQSIRLYDAAAAAFTTTGPLISEGLAVTGINFTPIAGTIARTIMIHAWCCWDADKTGRVMALFDELEGVDAKCCVYDEVSTGQNITQHMYYKLTDGVGGTPDTTQKDIRLRVGTTAGPAIITVNGVNPDTAFLGGTMTYGLEIIEYE